MLRTTLKEELMKSLKNCRPCNRRDTVMNRLSVDTGQTLYTSAEVLWILQMVLEGERHEQT